MVDGAVLAVALFIGGLLVLVAGAHAASTGSRRSNEVMPSRYESLLQTDPSNYPGYCTNCGTNNGPDRALCRECAAELPDSGRERHTGQFDKHG